MANERTATAEVARSAFTGNLARSALRGSVWTLIGHGTNQLMRLGSNLLLTRLLFPAVFGQMALVQIFVLGLGMFADIGSGPAIIQSPWGDDRRFLDTVWTLQFIRGVVLCLGTCVIALPVAAFYDQPELAWLIPAAGVGCIIQGFESTSWNTLKRHLRIGRVVVVDLISQAAGMLSVLGFVVWYRSAHGANDPKAVWAVLGGMLLGNTIRMILTHTALPGQRHRFLIDREHARRLMGFGRWVFISTALTFLGGQLDRLIFGKTIPIALLGVYGIAAMAAAIPSEAVLKLGSSVLFPAFSRVRARGDFARVFSRVRVLFLFGGALLVTGLVAAGPYLVRILWDARYADAAWMVRFLAFLAWFQILGATNEAAMLADGKPYWLAAGNLAKVAGMAGFVSLGFHFDGFRGALVGLVLAEASRYGVSAIAAHRRGLGSPALDVGVTLLIGAVALAGHAAGNSLAATAHPDLAGFLAAGAVVVLSWTLIVLASGGRAHAQQLVSTLRSR